MNSLKESLQFLQQPAEKLRQFRGAKLYDTLHTLGISQAQYLRALGTNYADYCAQEFGADLHNISVERFYTADPDARYTMPGFVQEAILTGMRKKPHYRDLIINDERINAAVYDVPFLVEDNTQDDLRRVAEGGAIPEATLTTGKRVIHLEKLARGTIATYEQVRRMSVDMFRVHLEHMGQRLGRMLDARLADVLVNGDSSGPATAPAVLNTAVAGTITYEDVLSAFLVLSLDNGYTPTHLVAGGAAGEALLRLDEFKDTTRFDTARTGNLPSPLGMKFIAIPEHAPNKVTLLDAGFAIQKLTEQDLLIEGDRLINQQWERVYLSVVTDFAVIYEKARVVLNSDWS